MTPERNDIGGVPHFRRGFFASGESFARLGEGEPGGKGRGLIFLERTLQARLDRSRFAAYEVRVPATVFLTTEFFDAFVDRNGLRELAFSDLPDAQIARLFQAGSLPTEILGNLQQLIEDVRVPLAIRSSALLEDTLERPFAGIYETKMTPNNQPEVAERFRKLVEAIKFVYASTYFGAARAYARVTGHDMGAEKMGVLIQEVVGSRRWDRFYPTVSGVGRSFDHYAATEASPEDGVFSLALGLGKTIVDGGACWNYSPRFPRRPPPFGSYRDLLRVSQNRFWAIQMGRPPAFDPIAEQEYLVQSDLAEAEHDGALQTVASTYDGASDRLVPGVRGDGPRVVDFGPLLRLSDDPFNELAQHLLEVTAGGAEGHVEIEVAVDWHPVREKPFFGVLQQRPMFVPAESLELEDLEAGEGEILLRSHAAVGHGMRREIRDLVYLPPERFRAEETALIAQEIASFNVRLVTEGRPYVLVGFGRWGTTDPWRGVPVLWEQISGAQVIVEGALPGFRADPSQGSHFFHNVTALRVFYLSLSESETAALDWSWLAAQETVLETAHARRVRLEQPLYIAVDGRKRRGAIWKYRPGALA